MVWWLTLFDQSQEPVAHPYLEHVCLTRLGMGQVGWRPVHIVAVLLVEPRVPEVVDHPGTPVVHVGGHRRVVVAQVVGVQVETI